MRIGIMLVALVVGVALVPTASADPGDLLRELVRKSGTVRTIDASIEQHIRYPGEAPEVFRGRYRADEDGRFRIDYRAPSEQRVLHTGSMLFWYYPASRLLYLIGDRSTPAHAPGASPVRELMKRLDERGRVEYRGRRLHGWFTLAQRFTVRGDDGGLAVDVWIDSRRGVVLERRLTDRRGREIMKEVFGDYAQAGGNYYPGRIDVHARSERGVVRSTTIYRDVRINIPLPADTFAPDFPRDAIRRTYRGR